MVKIDWKRKAVKQLRKVDHSNRKLITDSVEGLCKWPDCSNVIHLTNHQYQYRLRVGRYRVFFDVESSEVVIISIEEVKKRDERAY